MLDATQLMTREISFCQPMAEREGIDVAIVLHRIALIMLSQHYLGEVEYDDNGSIWGDFNSNYFYEPLEKIITRKRLDEILNNLMERKIIKTNGTKVTWDNGILDVDLEEIYVYRR